MQHLDARERLEADGRTLGQPVVVQVLADAARGVATHAGLRAVVVEDAHGEVAHSRGADEHQTVPADALVTVAPQHRKMFGAGQREAHGIDVDVVVARAVHFGKFNGMLHKNVFSNREPGMS